MDSFAKRIPLPKHWPGNVKNAVLHVISLAHIVIVHTRGLLVNSPNAQTRRAGDLLCVQTGKACSLDLSIAGYQYRSICSVPGERGLCSAYPLAIRMCCTSSTISGLPATNTSVELGESAPPSAGSRMPLFRTDWTRPTWPRQPGSGSGRLTVGRYTSVLQARSRASSSLR